MGELSKKLHILKSDNTEETITLYTAESDCIPPL